MYVPIVILSTKDNVNLTKQLNEGLKRSVYSNEYKSKIETQKYKIFLMLLFKELIDCLFLLLMILIMVIARLKETVIESISSQEFDNRNFNDQPINDQIRSMMKLERLQQEKEMITQLVAY